MPVALSPPLDLAAMLSDEGIAARWLQTVDELRRLGLPDDTGGTTPGECRLLYYLVAHMRPRSVLEIGTHIGASTSHLAAALRDQGPDGRLTTVDVVDVNAPDAAWSIARGIGRPRDLVASLGMGARTAFVTQPSLRFLETTPDAYDLIFLDGDHAAHTVYREVSAALQKIQPNGVIILHDYFHALQPIGDNPVIEGPYLALRRIQRESSQIVVQRFPSMPWLIKHGFETCVALVVAAQSDQRNHHKQSATSNVSREKKASET